MVAVKLADGFLADLGLTEDVYDLRLADPALTRRTRSLAWADSTISGGPAFGGQVALRAEVGEPCREVGEAIVAHGMWAYDA